MTDEPSTMDDANERARGSRSGNDSGGVLSADELTLDDDEHVRSLGDGRYLVSTDEVGPSSTPTGGRPRPTRSDGGRPVTDGSPAPTEALAQSSAGFGVDVAVKTESGVSRRRVTSNDIREVFTEMLRWYALQLDEETDPAETLAVLRAASELDF